MPTDVRPQRVDADLAVVTCDTEQLSAIIHTLCGYRIVPAAAESKLWSVPYPHPYVVSLQNYCPTFVRFV